MEILQKGRVHVPICCLLVFLLQFSNLHFLSFADDYYINCGSDANVNLTTGQNFVGDSNSGSSFSKSDAITYMNQLPASVSPLYQTARASSDPFYYEFKITIGTYLVRLHFLAFSSTSSNLSSAVFDVLDSTKFTLLNNFTAKNSTSSPLIKEFFIRIDSTDSFRLYFTPRTSSLAFVNAIEFLAIPSDFTNFIPENYTSNFPLQTIYRVNVGGPSQNDTLWRSWETDDTYLPDPNSAKDSNKGTLNRNYVGEIDGLVASNASVAPDWVYQTAKVMNITASRPANSSNITWSFRVSGNARHIVRAHFCDIIDQPYNVVFNLYSNGNLRKEIGSSNNTISGLSALPFYYDFMVSPSESELISITIRPNVEDATVQNAFLNGLEVLEIMEGVASIPNVKESKKNMVALVVGSVLGGLSLICVLVAGFVFCSRHRKAEKRVEIADWSPMLENGGSSYSRGTERTITGSPMNLMNLGLKISFAEIQSATNKFDTKLMIGKGGFGNVYRGTLYNGTKVAVKRAYKRDEHGSGSGQGRPEFQTEIMVLSKIRHRHLVSLIGYCDERSEMILVYEFMEKGTLRDHLYDSNLPRLTWKQRLEICTGAARGLHYLHTGAAGGIIHRDVKSTNILLDENHVAKVADFGLSRSGPLDETHVSTNVKGTFGYLDPEYMMSQQLTEKSDVYSFGVVLLEVLCGRPAIDPTLPREQMNLAEWGMLCKKKGLLEQIVDFPLKNQINPSSLRKFGDTVEKCLQEDASVRPTMADVLWDLEYALQLQQTTKLKEAHEDSTTIDGSSAAYRLPVVQRFPSLGSTINGDDMRDDELDTTENEIFSQLKIGDAILEKSTMEHVHIPLLSLLVFLLNLSSLHFLSLADDYYINCGSHDNASLNTTGQNFSGESKSGYSFSKSKAVVKDINQLLDIAPLYKTARGFSKAFYYQFNITQNGTYLVSLHFLAFSSSSSSSNNLSTAVFGVLDSKNFTLLNNFTAKNSTNYPVIKEFFVRIDITDSFRLYFIPQPSSFAFVNAIELFLAPSDFIPENNISNLPLHTIYRLNVGGSPWNDTKGRNWETDDSHLSDPNSAKNATPKSELNLNYLPGPVDGLFLSNYTFAPIQVYETAKHMSNSSSRPAISSNVTWFFSVSRKARHIVRAHFCDIIGQPGEIIFNLYSNGNLRKEISNISQYPAVPFYYDFLVNSSESELINITVKPKSESADAFLNGLEILEIVEGLAPIPTVRDSKKNIVAPVVGSVLGGLSLICVLIVGFVFGFRHRKAKKRVETSVWSPMPANGGGSSHSSALNLNYLGLKISFNEIQSATNNFDTNLVIGKGGFGNVYRGTLLNGTKVAVKRAYKRDEHGSGSGQGLPEFETEIIVLSKIRHRHLVSLIGYCNERSEMILVYEFMEKGTLRDHLYDSDVPRLSWKQRLEICTGAARGLHYLHTGAAGGIIHRDVKSTNILLDENHVAKVADFGLSRSGALDETHVSTNVKGTFGYLDPEYMMSEQLTEKSDVYSFGVVLLEVLCARPAIDPTLPREQMNLAEWGMLCQKRGLLEEIVDSPLKGQIDPNSLRKFGETVEKCLQEDACDRPTMADVLWDLEYALQLQQTTKLKEAHEDSTNIDASSAAFSLPNVQRFPSLGSTRNGDDIREADLETTESEIFSQLKIGDAR
ncbi:uncharacterized protein LOC133714784 [Rosa rugosa]|uniref:uncharacterized protein LOC133714784 n=1 Tax=Rosa rugosa TaxID=74645 RepID=UPI002B4184CD|nr:uncharacterized protein LOC133714784 [Rosa rugosa]